MRPRPPLFAARWTTCLRRLSSSQNCPQASIDLSSLKDPRYQEELSLVASSDEWKVIGKICGLSMTNTSPSKLCYAQKYCQALHAAVQADKQPHQPTLLLSVQFTSKSAVYACFQLESGNLTSYSEYLFDSPEDEEDLQWKNNNPYHDHLSKSHSLTVGRQMVKWIYEELLPMLLKHKIVQILVFQQATPSFPHLIHNAMKMNLLEGQFMAIFAARERDLHLSKQLYPILLFSTVSIHHIDYFCNVTSGKERKSTLSTWLTDYLQETVKQEDLLKQILDLPSSKLDRFAIPFAQVAFWLKAKSFLFTWHRHLSSRLLLNV